MSAERPLTEREREDEISIPVLFLSKEDLFYRREDLAETIMALTPSQLARLADKLSDALQDSYWTAMGIILMEQFGIAAEDEDEDVDDTLR